MRGERLRRSLHHETRDVPVTLGEAFASISALYFRGKLAYASHFGHNTGSIEAVQIITPSRGLLPASTPATATMLDEFASTRVDAEERAYREPLAGSLRQLGLGLEHDVPIVFLGSLATAKYTKVLGVELAGRVWVPSDFAGMGNMQRGSVLLKAVEANRPMELEPLEVDATPAAHHARGRTRRLRS